MPCGPAWRCVPDEAQSRGAFHPDGRRRDQRGRAARGLAQPDRPGLRRDRRTVSGAEGALYAYGERLERLRSPQVPVVSAVGAGDSMLCHRAGTGGWAFGRRGGAPGIAAGAATVMRPGTELCHREDVQRLLEALERALVDPVDPWKLGGECLGHRYHPRLPIVVEHEAGLAMAISTPSAGRVMRKMMSPPYLLKSITPTSNSSASRAWASAL